MFNNICGYSGRVRVSFVAQLSASLAVMLVPFFSPTSDRELSKYIQLSRNGFEAQLDTETARLRVKESLSRARQCQLSVKHDECILWL